MTHNRKPRQDPYGPDTIPYDLIDLLSQAKRPLYVLKEDEGMFEECNRLQNAEIAIGLQIAVSLSNIDGGTWKGIPKKEGV